MDSFKSLLLFFLMFPANSQAQSYFQQEVNHTIAVTLNDQLHTLSGFESVEYINNSQDTLAYLFFHLWPNAYRNNHTAFARQTLSMGDTKCWFARDEERGYIDSLHFTAGGLPLRWEPDQKHADIGRIFPERPLLPGDTIIIETPFFVKIPGSFSRMGHVNQSYQITQWFPKPAVYDRDGWHPMPYLELGEFYSEFGTYDVSITVPGEYVVAATGSLMDTAELKWLERKAREPGYQSVPPAQTASSLPKYKTLHFRAEKVHDFAWFADKDYRISRGELQLPGGRSITTWAYYFPSEAVEWKKATGCIGDALRYYSSWYGDYPYENCTAVSGLVSSFMAMEYPTITVIGRGFKGTMLENVIMHEVGHNWFYGMLGFNERDYPWLDEGINSFSEFRYMRTKYPDMKMYELYFQHPGLAGFLNIKDFPFSMNYEIPYLLSARVNADQAMMMPSEDFTLLNYLAVIYRKSALSFEYLRQYLGEEEFNRIMQRFFDEWKFRHPGPGDLQKAFEDETEKDLSWFFNDLITTTEKIDYKISRFRGDSLLVKNRGNIASPVYIRGTLGQDPVIEEWKEGFNGKQWMKLPAGDADRLILFDSVWLPEINRKNNTLREKGLFPALEPLNIHFTQLLEKPGRMQAGILPAVGWNYYNKLMLGVLLYSPLLPQQTFEYQLAPMFALGNKDLTGIGSIGLNFYPRIPVIQSLRFRLSAMSFGFDADRNGSFNRARADMLIGFKKNQPTSPVNNSLRLSLVGADAMHDYTPSSEYLFKMYYGIMEFRHENRNTLNPYRGILNTELARDYLKTFLELHYTRAFGYAKDAIQVKLFSGGFLYKESDFNQIYSFHLGGSNGTRDYRYESLFLGRFETMSDQDRQKLLSQQFVADQGGFASYHSFAMSDQWMVTAGINLRVYRLPVYIYANTGTYSGAGTTERVLGEEVITSRALPYEIGAMINLGQFIKVYFPFTVSSDIRKVNDFYTDNYWQTIRYSIDFNLINPVRLKEKLF